MRLSILATALFSLSAIVASPAGPVEARNALAAEQLDARDVELDARTFWSKCKLSDKWACYKKGERFKWYVTSAPSPTLEVRVEWPF